MGGFFIFLLLELFLFPSVGMPEKTINRRA